MDRLAHASAMLGFFLRTKLLGQKLPLLASIKLTYRCNLACSGCPFHQRAGMPGSHMTKDDAFRSLDILKHKGCNIIVFEGGEPLLWRDGDYTFTDLVHHARKNFLCVGATTNGTLSLDAPTDILWVSVDGLKPSHDALRSNSYDAIMANIRSSRHPKLLVHYTLNAGNWRDFAAAADMLSSLDQVKGITVQFFYPYDQGEEDLKLSPEDRSQAVQTILRLKRLGYPIMNSKWSLKSMIHNTWRCHDRLLANVEPDGSVSIGCYVKNRGEIKCRECGFTPVAEASGAMDLKLGSLKAGWDIFFS